MNVHEKTIPVRYPHEAPPVGIVADGAIAISGFYGGRSLPILLLDLTKRPDVANFIRIHRNMGFGDVTIQWGNLENKKGNITLFLHCVRPVELFLAIDFDIRKQGILIDQALRAGGLYIAEAVSADDRFARDPGRRSVAIDIPDTGFQPMFERMFQHEMHKYFKTNGLSTSASRSAAASALQTMREVLDVRMGDEGGFIPNSEARVTEDREAARENDN